MIITNNTKNSDHMRMAIITVVCCCCCCWPTSFRTDNATYNNNITKSQPHIRKENTNWNEIDLFAKVERGGNGAAAVIVLCVAVEIRKKVRQGERKVGIKWRKLVLAKTLKSIDWRKSEEKLDETIGSIEWGRGWEVRWCGDSAT